MRLDEDFLHLLASIGYQPSPSSPLLVVQNAVCKIYQAFPTFLYCKFGGGQGYRGTQKLYYAPFSVCTSRESGLLLK